MDLSQFASQPQKGKKSVLVPAQYVGFMGFVAQSKLRMDYSGHSLLCGRLGMVTEAASLLPNGGNRFLNYLPLAEQFVVCQKKGGYHPTALAKWSEQAPTGFAAFPIILGGQVVAAFEQWVAEEAAPTVPAAPATDA